MRNFKDTFETRERSFFILRDCNFIFQIYDVTAWLTNNYNTHITQYLKK